MPQLCACRPRLAIVSTPNMEYNQVIRFAQPLPDTKRSNMPIGSDGFPMREADHKFEWSRGEFRDWATKVANIWGYGVSFMGVGTALDEDDWRLSLGDGEAAAGNVGHATQVRGACHPIPAPSFLLGTTPLAVRGVYRSTCSLAHRTCTFSIT